VSVDLSVKFSVRYSSLVNLPLNRFITFTTNTQIVRIYRVGDCIVLNCVKVANKIRYIPKITLVMASSRVIEVEEYEEVVSHPDSSPVLRRSSSAESVNDVSPLQEPMMEVEEEFATTSRPTLRYTEPELAEQTQVPRKVRVATLSPERGVRTYERQSLDRLRIGMYVVAQTSEHGERMSEYFEDRGAGFRSRDTGSTSKSWVDENSCVEVVGDNGSQTPVRGVNGRAGNVGQTSGSESSYTDVHLGSVGERLSLAGLTTSVLIDKSGDVGNGGDDDGPTMDVYGVRVHSTGDEYDNEGAGHVGETATSRSASANTNGHLGYVVERISLAGVATSRQINDRSGSREVIGLATQSGGVAVHTPGGRVDNDGAGYVDDSSIYGLSEDAVGRNSRVGSVSADEINGQAVMGLMVEGDAVSPSTVAVANVEPVVSTMEFAGLDGGNGDAGQHGPPRCPGVNNDVVVPVLGVHGPPVQGDADRCGQSTTSGTLADDDDGSGPKRWPGRSPGQRGPVNAQRRCRWV